MTWHWPTTRNCRPKPPRQSAASLRETGTALRLPVEMTMWKSIHAATDLLAEAKLSPELRNEALYYRAKAYLNQKADKKAMDDLQLLAKDTRTLYGAEAKYLVAQGLYDAKEYALQKRKSLISSTKAHRMPTGWHAVSSFCLMYM